AGGGHSLMDRFCVKALELGLLLPPYPTHPLCCPEARMSNNNITTCNLQISQVLYDFIEKEAAPGTGITPDQFWDALCKILDRMAPRNRALLQKRDELQAKIDAWHKEHDVQYYLEHRAEYKKFLQDIGYLVPVGDDFKIGTRGSDYEISIVAGPQLVVPVMNARYALNAANARWGSLFD